LILYASSVKVKPTLTRIKYMPRTLAPTRLTRDIDLWLEEKKIETDTSFSQIARDALRVAMEKDKRKNK
tara:strand:+ start:203 stop:409 length:207 start_codon:yes stop_codon:yes gene_type:complete